MTFVGDVVSCCEIVWDIVRWYEILWDAVRCEILGDAVRYYDIVSIPWYARYQSLSTCHEVHTLLAMVLARDRTISTPNRNRICQNRTSKITDTVESSRPGIIFFTDNKMLVYFLTWLLVTFSTCDLFNGADVEFNISLLSWPV